MPVRDLKHQGKKGHDLLDDELFTFDKEVIDSLLHWEECNDTFGIECLLLLL